MVGLLKENKMEKLEPCKNYVIDFDKIETIEDIKLILKALDIGFSPTYPNQFDEIKHFLKERMFQ